MPPPPHIHQTLIEKRQVRHTAQTHHNTITGVQRDNGGRVPGGIHVDIDVVQGMEGEGWWKRGLVVESQGGGVYHQL